MKLLSLIAFVPCLLVAQEHRIPAQVQTKHDYYSKAIFLSQGPLAVIATSSSDTVTDRSFRVVITAQAVFGGKGEGGYDIFIEEMTFGEEGCCRNLVRIQRIEPRDIMQAFSIEGEPWKLRFVEWLSPTSFFFDLADTRFRMTYVDKSSVTVSKSK